MIRQPDIGHMPFSGHRTQKEVREDAERRAQRSRQACDPAKLGKDQLPWCPKEYRGEYQRLRNGQKLGAAEARRLIEQQISTDARRGATFVPLGERPLIKAHTAR